MLKFPIDAPLNRVIKALAALGFVIAREGNHIALERQNKDRTVTPMTLPNHRVIKSSTLRRILTDAEISRDDFLDAYENA